MPNQSRAERGHPHPRSGADTVPLADRTADLALGARAEPARLALFLFHRDGVESVLLEAGRPVVVGRSEPADVVVPDVSLSRAHASFVLEEGRVVVRDLESTNGTFVGGARVEELALEAGQEVTLGSLVAAVQVLPARTAAGLGVDGHERFLAALEAELLRARFFARPLAIALVRPLQGGVHVRTWLERVKARLRPVDEVGLYSRDTVELLLPEATADDARELARTLVGAGAGDVPLGCAVAAFPESGTSAEALVEVLRAASHRVSAANPIEVARPAAQSSPPSSKAGEIVADSAAMRAVLDSATRLARSPIPVLLRGETGTGKELVARLIHEGGPRKKGPLVCVNCGAIPASLLESTLFGHERGAFTGANQAQKGLFEAASGGTLFLDEIGELPPPAQAALLRALETKRITRVGAHKETAVDVRVVAATHRDLEKMASEGTFRSDLLFRLNAVLIELPPLRARPEDVPTLAQRFLHEAGTAAGTPKEISPQALRALQAYAWPGNIRELRNAIERAVAISAGDVVGVEDLPERVRKVTRPGAIAEPKAPAEPADPGLGLRERVARFEASVILEALRTRPSQIEAAKALKLPVRTLSHRMKVLKIKKLGFGTD